MSTSNASKDSQIPVKKARTHKKHFTDTLHDKKKQLEKILRKGTEPTSGFKHAHRTYRDRIQAQVMPYCNVWRIFIHVTEHLGMVSSII